MSKSISGGCACGKVSYIAEAMPLMSAHCHCTMCRKLSGTGHSSFAAVPRALTQFKGAMQSFNFIADSGNKVTRWFCANCCSPIYAENNSMADLVMLCASNLNDPTVFEPGMVVYTGSAVNWDLVDESLPAFAGMAPMPES